MDPIGNIAPFLSILKTVPQERRRIVLVREILLAYCVLLVFLFFGTYLLRFLRLEQETLSIAGGIVLFLIALRMIFPHEGGVVGEPLEGEPFLVPLAIPLFAGPSTLAALLLLQRSSPGDSTSLLIAVTIAWAIGGSILLSSTFFYRVLRERGTDRHRTAHGHAAGHGVGPDAHERIEDFAARAGLRAEPAEAGHYRFNGHSSRTTSLRPFDRRRPAPAGGLEDRVADDAHQRRRRPSGDHRSRARRAPRGIYGQRRHRRQLADHPRRHRLHLVAVLGHERARFALRRRRRSRQGRSHGVPGVSHRDVPVVRRDGPARLPCLAVAARLRERRAGRRRPRRCRSSASCSSSSAA